MGREIARTALNLILFFAILFIFTKIIGPIPFSIDSVTTTKSTTFDVTAEGKTQVKPDVSKVSAGVSATGSTTGEVQNKIDSIISKVSQEVKKLGIDEKDIKTANYNINPTYDERGSIKGYSGNTTLTIKVKEIGRVNSVIDSAVSSGATNVNNLGFEVGDREKYENEARSQAVMKAKKKAEDAAEIAGFRLGKIINYSENFGDVGRPIPLSLEAREEAATPIEPGTEEIKVTITLSYEIK